MGTKPRPLGPDQLYHNARRDYIGSLYFHIAAGRYLQRKGWSVEDIKIAFGLLTTREVDKMIRDMRARETGKHIPHVGLKQQRKAFNSMHHLVHRHGVKNIEALDADEQIHAHDLGFLTDDEGWFTGECVNEDGSIVTIARRGS